MKNLLSPFLLIITLLCFSACTTEEPVNQVHNELREILNENTLGDWKGDPALWRFEDDILIGETTPENIIAEHSFFIWENELVEDFELTLEYRISDRGNSGINYRSEIVNGKEFVMRGYQADIDGANEYTGQLYEDKGRAFLARRGQAVVIDENNKKHEAGILGDPDVLLSQIKKNDWNTYKITAKGNTLIHNINGQIMSVATDHGTGMESQGLLGFQLHLGPPMKIEYKNILFKKL